MSISHLKPGETMQLALREELPDSKTTTLVKTEELELIRLVLPAGKMIPAHRVPGPITVQCIEGRVSFTAREKSRTLHPGELLYLLSGDEHSVTAIDNSSLLITLLLSKVNHNESTIFNRPQQKSSSDGRGHSNLRD